MAQNHFKKTYAVQLFHLYYDSIYQYNAIDYIIFWKQLFVIRTSGVTDDACSLYKQLKIIKCTYAIKINGRRFLTLLNIAMAKKETDFVDGSIRRKRVIENLKLFSVILLD